MSSSITIIGAGASGLFCASLLGQQGFNVTVIDNGKKPGRKILMSGGGFCNFTNQTITADNYLSQNVHFCKSAIKRFSQCDFIDLVNRYNIPYYEKELGQLFCQNSAQDIVNMLITECQKGSVKFSMQTELDDIVQTTSGFVLSTNKGKIETDKVIIATGGLSMPKLGTTPIGYKIAEKFALPVIPIKAGLVPFTLQPLLLERLSPLAGISVLAEVSTNNKSFFGNILFTHRGLSGPAILQISSYWQPGEAISINLLPNQNLTDFFTTQRQESANQQLKNVLAKLLPKRLIDCLSQLEMIADIPLKQLNIKHQQTLIEQLTNWQIVPNGTEGYRTAEVTLGGVSTECLSSKTMEVKTVSNLYFIGEVIDVTGWLGGYNFQWAWSSAYACAESIIKTAIVK
ncbi:BaiN/RdsA family NAD(P)/FAD-dependent oxidoreductase [Orbus mooreae]|uniref:NAD(P)/FAD-dependent oxidoreductase n=1 Tax=Orbus mooreae TaxID=3074107 RepID=UPI00370D3914